MGGGGSESSQVAISEAEHHDGIIFIKENEPAEPGGWRVDAGSVPPAAVSESRADAFIFAGLAAVLSSDMIYILCLCVCVCLCMQHLGMVAISTPCLY